MDTTLLEKIGLSNAEIKVYLALLALGTTPSGRIIKETNLRKSTVYESIKRLEEKGLISHHIKEYKRHFQAQPPENILEFIEEQEREIKQTKTQAKEFIKKLEKGFLTKKPEAEAHVLSGIEGFKSMRKDVLKHAKKEHLLIGAISRESEVIPGFFEEWNKERQKKCITLKILHKESARKKAMSNQKYMGKHFQTKFLPKDLESPAVINIYGDRVVNVLWKNNQPICFLLINKDIAESYRKYFHYLWELAKC